MNKLSHVYPYIQPSIIYHLFIHPGKDLLSEKGRGTLSRAKTLFRVKVMMLRAEKPAKMVFNIFI